MVKTLFDLKDALVPGVQKTLNLLKLNPILRIGQPGYPFRLHHQSQREWDTEGKLNIFMHSNKV